MLIGMLTTDFFLSVKSTWILAVTNFCRVKVLHHVGVAAESFECTSFGWDGSADLLGTYLKM